MDIKKLVPIMVTVLIAFGVLVVSGAGCAKIESGQQGILWTALSGTKDGIYGEGYHVVAPWNKMYIYDVRVQDAKETLHLMSSNGLSIDLETSIRYRPKTGEIVELHRQVGPSYYETILAPSFRSEARQVAGRFSPEEIYSTKREEMERDMLAEVQKAIDGRHVELEAILVRDVQLPEQLKGAIADKLEEEQRALKMQYTLQRETQEAERKRVEAQGIADFQKIITTGLTPELLQWKGIEATQDLAQSQNAKIVVVGGQDGLPLIFNAGQ
jgi:regulator of protease activity HflC (stomatin/prohibitin superfamily)